MSGGAAARAGRDEWPDASWTVARYLEWDIANYVEPLLKRTTLQQYRNARDNWWGPTLGGIRLGDLTMHDVQQAVTANLERRSVMPSTAKTALSMLCSALERARQNRIIDRNPAEKVRGPRMMPSRTRALSPDELGRWLDAALLPSGLGGYIWAGPMLATAPLTGLRLGELRGLRWENVDLWDRPEGDTTGMIHVVEQIDSATRHTAWCEPKSVSGHRHVPIPPVIGEVLVAHRARMERHALQMGTRRWREHDLVFPSTLGNALSMVTIGAAREKVARLAMIDPTPMRIPAKAIRYSGACRSLGVPWRCETIG